MDQATVGGVQVKLGRGQLTDLRQARGTGGPSHVATIVATSCTAPLRVAGGELLSLPSAGTGVAAFPFDAIPIANTGA